MIYLLALFLSLFCYCALCAIREDNLILARFGAIYASLFVGASVLAWSLL